MKCSHKFLFVVKNKHKLRIKINTVYLSLYCCNVFIILFDIFIIIFLHINIYVYISGGHRLFFLI